MSDSENTPEEIEPALDVEAAPAVLTMPLESPITETLDTWPLAGDHTLRWGRDADGAMWVAVENGAGACRSYLPYLEYLEMEQMRKRIR
jgi:hypothetical protein